MLPLSWRSVLMVISDMELMSNALKCQICIVLVCAWKKSCKCNEGHSGFMKRSCRASHRRSNMAFYFVWICMCLSMFACVTGSFSGVFLFACLPVKWKNGKLNWPFLFSSSSHGGLFLAVVLLGVNAWHQPALWTALQLLATCIAKACEAPFSSN